MPVLPGAEPFSADAGDIGVVLCHGFTGSPQSLRPWAEALARAGHTVRLPRLPGHGTTWQELNRTRWPQWYAAVDEAFAEVRERCPHVFVAGLSMGGALALRLAEEHGDEVRGVIVVNPYVGLRHPLLPVLPALRWVMPTFPGVASDIKKQGVTELAYDRVPLHALASTLRLHAAVRADLGRITQPLLVLRSAVDHVVPAEINSVVVLAGVRSSDVTEIVLEDSYHVATLDNDAPTIFAGSADFIRRVSAG